MLFVVGILVLVLVYLTRQQSLTLLIIIYIDIISNIHFIISAKL